MRRIVPLICTVALFAFASLGLAQTVATDPVGFITLNVQGTTGLPGGATSALSFLGLAFTQPVSYQATLASASGTTLTDSSATWSDNQFNGANGNFYVELTAGTGAGVMSQITATSGANKTITTADDLKLFRHCGVLVIKIRPNWTLAGVFGTTDQSGLQGGTASTADQILVYSTSTGLYTTYFYQTSGIGGVGWRKVGDTTHADQSGAFFKATDGMLVKRFQSASLSFALAGAVKLGQTAIPVAAGLNILSNVYPSGTFTLGTSGLQASGLGGGTASTADLVLIYDQVNAIYNSYYYQTSGIGGTGWRLVGDTTHADKSGITIPFGDSILIQRKAATAFTWVAPQPF